MKINHEKPRSFSSLPIYCVPKTWENHGLRTLTNQPVISLHHKIARQSWMLLYFKLLKRGMNKYFTNHNEEDLFSPLCPDIHVPAEYLRVWRIHEEKGSIQLQQVEAHENSYGSYLVRYFAFYRLSFFQCCFKTTTNMESLNALNGVASAYFTDAIQA